METALAPLPGHLQTETSSEGKSSILDFLPSRLRSKISIYAEVRLEGIAETEVVFTWEEDEKEKEKEKERAKGKEGRKLVHLGSIDYIGLSQLAQALEITSPASPRIPVIFWREDGCRPALSMPIAGRAVIVPSLFDFEISKVPKIEYFTGVITIFQRYYDYAGTSLLVPKESTQWRLLCSTEQTLAFPLLLDDWKTTHWNDFNTLLQEEEVSQIVRGIHGSTIFLSFKLLSPTKIRDMQMKNSSISWQAEAPLIVVYHKEK
jgi:hypothetical protein